MDSKNYQEQFNLMIKILSWRFQFIYESLRPAFEDMDDEEQASFYKELPQHIIFDQEEVPDDEVLELISKN